MSASPSPSPRGVPQGLMRTAFVLPGMLAAYVLAGLASIHAFTPVPPLPLVWLPAAVVLLAVVRLGPRWAMLAPAGLALTQLVVDALPAGYLPFAMVSHAAGAWLTGILVERRPTSPEASLPWVLRVAASAVAMPLAVVMGAVLGGHVAFVDMSSAETILRLGLAEALGIACLAPVLLLAFAPRPALRGFKGRARAPAERYLWLAMLLVSLIGMGWASSHPQGYPLGLSVLPLGVLLWGAIRMRPWEVALAACGTVLVFMAMLSAGLPGLPAPVLPADYASLLAFLCLFPVMPVLLAFVIRQQQVDEIRLLERATRDPLTGLLNRAAFEQAVAMDINDPAAPPMALAYLDLDNVALINDTSGHAAGDDVIRGVGGLLEGWRQPGDQVAHVSGDEFILLLRNCSAMVAEDRIRSLLADIERSRTRWEDRFLATTASAGLVPFLPGQARFGELLSQADAACMSAKELGGNRVHLTRLHQGGRDSHAAAMHSAVRLRDAIEQGRIELHAQCIRPLQRDAMPGLHVELLLRARDDAGRLMMPADVIPAAERFNLGPRLDRHVVEHALRWLEGHPAAWQVATCAINLTGDSVANEAFIAFALERISRSSFPADQLCFEITETSAVRNIARARRFVAQLRGLGCRVALDDFGSGFCSFGYLSSLDVDYFKIDGSFVRGIASSPLSEAVVRSITGIAHSLGKQAIAEHVETEAARELLAAIGVDYAQGFLLDRPRPFGELLDEVANKVRRLRPG